MWRNLRLDSPGCRPGALRDEQGVVLILVLLVLTLISVLVLSWAEEWRTELQLAANFRESYKCRRLAEGGVYYALGKLVETKLLENSVNYPGGAAAEAEARLATAWQGDQKVHQVQMPGGLVQVQLADEGGKINVNQASEDSLLTLFTVLGFSPNQVRIMVDSIQDWRSSGNQPRPMGAKSPYYLRLDPPYVARNGPLEVLEELAWVRGFENIMMVPKLEQWLTVMGTGQGINVNAAPLAVLVAAGLPPETARSVIMMRQSHPLRNFQDIAQLGLPAMPSTGAQGTQLSFVSQPFFTIKSTGMVNKNGGKYTVKAVVRIDISLPSCWQIMSWVDDFPG